MRSKVKARGARVVRELVRELVREPVRELTGARALGQERSLARARGRSAGRFGRSLRAAALRPEVGSHRSMRPPRSPTSPVRGSGKRHLRSRARLGARLDHSAACSDKRSWCKPLKLSKPSATMLKSNIIFILRPNGRVGVHKHLILLAYLDIRAAIDLPSQASQTVSLRAGRTLPGPPRHPFVDSSRCAYEGRQTRVSSFSARRK